MPSIRIGFSTDLNLVNEQVGIGTTNPTARLDVRGQIRADNSAGSGGISTLTRYDGFLNKTQSLPNNVSIAQTTKGNLNSLSGEIVIDGEITVTEGTPLTGGRLDSLTVTGTFDLPHGGTLGRELTPEKGSTRFNQDLGQLEFYTGLEWRTVGSIDGSGRGRGVFGGGYDPVQATIDYVNISTLGNATNFGSLTQDRRAIGSCSSSTRGLFAGGGNPFPNFNIIDYVTIASQGNAIDFGDLLSAVRWLSGCSSSTRGIFAGPQTDNVIQYVTISTLGNALDFGDLTVPRFAGGALSSSTRGVMMGGSGPGGIPTNTIDFITISSTGNSTYFGDLCYETAGNSSSSNSVRGLTFNGSGNRSDTYYSNSISYITIASTGDAIDFGDTSTTAVNRSSCATSTRSLIAGGYVSPSVTSINTVEYVTIASAGDAQDFGDLSADRRGLGACSDSHGGLGGF